MPVGIAMMPKPNVITTEASNRPEDEGLVGLAHRSNRFQHRGPQALSLAAVALHPPNPAGGLSNAESQACPSCRPQTGLPHGRR